MFQTGAEWRVQHSFTVFKRHPDIFKKDAPKKYFDEDGHSDNWLNYWVSNPINHSTKNNQVNPDNYWFVVEDEMFKPAFHVSESNIDVLHRLVQELIDFRLMQCIATN